MVSRSLLGKLHVKAGHRVAIVNAPRGFINSLGDFPPGVTSTEALGAPVDFALLFAQTSEVVERLVPEALKVLKPDGMLWVCYPKGTSRVRTDLNRDILWKLAGKFKLTGVSMVSIDETWSAMRLRAVDRVGK